jgi:hypothetical protein
MVLQVTGVVLPVRPMVSPVLHPMPSMFQRFMNNIFSDMLDISVIIYLDNILIYSNGNLSNMPFLTPEGLTMDPTKVETIMTWPVLWKVKYLQSFLGFANFYCRFI